MKMYKYRISKWGLRKYLKAGEAQNIIRRMEMGQKTELPIVQGRQLGSRQLKAKAEQANRVRLLVRQHVLRQGLNGRIEAPDMLHTLESALFFVRANASEQMSYGRSSYPVNMATVQESWGEIERTSAWWADMQSAASQLKQQRDSAPGFAALSRCFAQYGMKPCRGDFSMAWCTYTSLLLLYEIGEDLGRLFGRYVFNLSTIRYGESHPSTQRWAQILKLDADSRNETFASLLQAEFSVAQEYTPPESPFWLTITVLCLGYSCGEGLVSPETGVSQLGEAIGSEHVGSKLVKSNNQSTSRHYALCPTTSVTSSLQSAYLGTSLSWGDMPLKILLHLAQTNTSIPREHIVDALYLVSAMLDCTNEVRPSERYLTTALNILQLEMPDDHSRIGLVYSKLESMRLRRGDTTGAEAARLLHSRWLAESQRAPDRNTLADQPAMSIRLGSRMNHPANREGQSEESLTEPKNEVLENTTV